MSKKDKLLASAQKSLQKGQLGKAIKEYQKIVQTDPRDIRSRQKLGELLGRDNKIAAALEEYEAVAKHYSDGGFYLKAIAVYKQMQKLDQGQVEIYHNLAELNEKQGLVGNAMAEYRNLAAHYEKQEMFPEVLEVLQKMRDLEPENLNVLVKIAETYARTGETEEARKEFDEALDMLRGKGDFGRVLKLYEIFLPLFPDEPEMKIGLAGALVERGDADKGIQLLQNLLKEHPEHPGILRSLADGYRKTGSYENERLTYLHLLRHSPDDLELRQKALYASVDTGEAQRAREEIAEWRESFSAAGMDDVVRCLLERLAGRESGAVDPATGISSSGASGPAATSAESPEPIVEEASFTTDELGDSGPELVLDDSLLEASADPADEGAAEAGGGEGSEEIPLEFLEAVEQEGGLTGDDEEPPSTSEEPEATGELEAPEAESSTGAASGDAAAEEDVELELELDMDGVEEFEFDFGDDEAGQAGQVAPGEPDEVPDELEELEELETLEEIEELEDILEPEGAAAAEAPLDVQAELEEAEFYLQQGLLDEAERICRDLLDAGGDSPDLQAKLDQLAECRQQVAPAAGDVEGLFDLASELGDEGFPALDEAQVEFADSQKGVQTEIDGEDTESHYNLGIAYKEMGLLEDAIAEFDKAMGCSGRRVACLTLKGICHAERGAFSEGEDVFRAALGEDLADDERTSLHYELGVLYERWGRMPEALESFQKAADADPFFRDAGEKIARLRKELGIAEGGDGEQEGGKGSKDRVSYV